jgi:SNF2 family DNA or RNA helicase
MIIFPPTPGTAKVVAKERENVHFTAQEILDAGQPLGYGAIPELRREMGLEKLPQCVAWIIDQLESGCEKMVVFGYHREVLEGLMLDLYKYNPALVYGSTSMPTRQLLVDKFQESPDCRVIIGGWLPLGTGWTLTAADTVVMVESSFVPGQNDQCKDRLVRIGQQAGSVNVYQLVVEGSVEASVLAKAASKRYDIDKVNN